MRDKFWELSEKTRLGSLLKISKDQDKLENSNAPGLGKKIIESQQKQSKDVSEEIDYKADS